MVDAIISKIKRLNALFLVTVVLPTSLAILYYGLFASDIYISESRFVVRSPDKPSTNSLGLLFKSTGFARAGDEIYATQDYIQSRDAMLAANKGHWIERAFSSGAISIIDRYNPMGWDSSTESLYRYYTGKVSVSHDTTSSITTLTVRAFSPQDAEKLNRQLIEQSEALVNRLNVRGRQDLISSAEREVAAAKDQSTSAATALANFRNREGVVDPERQAAVQLQMISKLQDELISAKTQLAQLRRFTPRNPQVEVLETQVHELSGQIDEQLGKVAGDRRSLAATVAQYQRLQLEAQFSDKQLASALASLQEARNEAQRKQAYVERIVQPNLPDEALEPRRLRGIFAAFVVGMLAWGILSMLLAGVKEHKG